MPGGPGADPAAPLRALYSAFEAENAWWRSGRGAFARPDADAARVLREVRLSEDGGLAPPCRGRSGWRCSTGSRRHPKRSGPRRRSMSPGSRRGSAAAIHACAGCGSSSSRSLSASSARPRRRHRSRRSKRSRASSTRGRCCSRSSALDRAIPAFFAAAVTGARSSLAFRVPEDLRARARGLPGGARRRGPRALQRGARHAGSRAPGAVAAAGAPAGRRAVGARPRWLGRSRRCCRPSPVRWVATLADADETVLRAMAGIAADRLAGSSFDWEGLWYRAQPERAELRRLEGVRRRQGGQSLGRRCGTAARRPKSSVTLCAGAVGEALTSLVYAVHLGEPDGPALRGEDPARRHAVPAGCLGAAERGVGAGRAVARAGVAAGSRDGARAARRCIGSMPTSCPIEHP